MDLAKTYDSGQVFSWKIVDGNYIAPIGTALYELRQMEEGLCEAKLISGPSQEEDFIRYFDLRRDYGEIYNHIVGRHPELTGAVHRGRGIRLLKQDSTEMLLTFIYSQNNHIPRIRKSMEGLKELYGPEIGTYKGHRFYALPGDEVLKGLTEENFIALGAGYRAPYLVSAIANIGDLRAGYPDTDVDSAALVARLQEIHGIGPKVAACIALFGYGCWDVFPIDTWVRKALKHYYGSEAEKSGFIKQKVGEFGPYSSLVQQLMFYHMREGVKDERRPKNQQSRGRAKG